MWSVKIMYLYKFGVFLCVALAALMGLSQQAKADVADPVTKRAAAPLEGKLTQWRVVMDDKKGETFADAKSVKPGDVIEYRSTYSNISKKTVSSLVVVLPLPEGSEYLADSSKPAAPAAQAATKDGQYFAQPLVRTVKDKDGQAHTERVPYYDYRSLRWSVGDLLPGKSFEIKARVRVGTSQPEFEPKAAQAPPGAGALPTAVSVARQ